MAKNLDKSRSKSPSAARAAKRPVEVTLKTFQYRVYPSSGQEQDLEKILEHTRKDIYNPALRERIKAYRMYKAGRSDKKGIGKFDQFTHFLTPLRNSSDHVEKFLLDIQRGALTRLDEAYKHFFRRVKEKTENKYGFPKFKGKRHWNSITSIRKPVYTPPPDGGRYGKLKIQNVRGTLKVRHKRDIDGNMRTWQLQRDAKGWRLTIQAEVLNRKFISGSGKWVGLDMGIRVFVTTSDGERFENPKLLEKEQKRLRKAQRNLSRKVEARKKGRTINKRAKSRRHKQALEAFQNLHWRVKERRRGMHYRVIDDLINQYDTIVVEDIEAKSLQDKQGKRTRRRQTDIAWGNFVIKLEQKLREGENKNPLIKVDPVCTSKICHRCGERGSRNGERFSCTNESCRYKGDADFNGAQNILLRGYAAVSENGQVPASRKSNPICSRSDIVGGGDFSETGYKKNRDSVAVFPKPVVRKSSKNKGSISPHGS